jgi:hypothetical protein
LKKSQIPPGIRLPGKNPMGLTLHPNRSPESIMKSESFFSKTFPSSGYTVVRSPGMVFTFDHGRLGLPPLYNHGHADALSVTLSMNGRGILVDSGTYRYNQAPEWRRYFRSTRAHNTVTIDGVDQAVQESGFIWSHAFNIKLLEHSRKNGALFLEALHTGYQRLRQAVIHRRKVAVRPGQILIEDSFAGEGVHTFELNFHLHPDAVPFSGADGWVIQHGEERVLLRLEAGGDLCSVIGEKEPILGWYSPRYGLKQESPVLRCLQHAAPKEVTFATIIRFVPATEMDEPPPLI